MGEYDPTIKRKYMRYEQHVNTLAEAWVLIMEHVDEFKTPTITIEGLLGNWDDIDDPPRIMYRASVAGDVEGGW
jgi:hypothetical protein